MRKLSFKMADTPSVAVSVATEPPAMAAQDLLIMPGAVLKSGFLRQRQVMFRLVKWSQRFIILSKDSLVVYDNERSKTPKLQLNLMGYNGVKRVTSHKVAWAFSVCPAVNSVKHQTFSCTSDRDRKEWMTHLRNVLYTANNIEKPKLTVMDSFMESIDFDINADAEYEALEKHVFETARKGSIARSLPDSEDGGKELIEEVLDDEDDDEGSDGHKEVVSPTPRSSTQKTSAYSPKDNTAPPRYSTVVEEGGYSGESASTSLEVENPLEQTCTINDSSINRDRDKVISMLKATGGVGTYAIRMSRKDDSKVLAVVAEDNTVREFKIQEEHGHFRLDTSAEFISVEALLTHFSEKRPIPRCNFFLTNGIYAVLDEEDIYEVI